MNRPDSHQAPAPRSLAGSWFLSSLAVVALHAAVLLLLRWSTGPLLVDDAGITFAYVETFVSTGTLAIRPGEAPVEALSNVLWFVLLVPFELLRIPLGAAAVGLAVASSAAVTLLIARFTCRALRYQQPWQPLQVSLLVASAMLSELHWLLWLGGGLEGPLVALLWIALALWLREPPGADARTWLPVLLCVAAFLCRPDGILVPFFMLGTALIQDVASPATRGRAVLGRYVRIAAGVTAGVATATLTRLMVWGTVLPNSFYAKSPAEHGGSQWSDLSGAGWSYVRRFYWAHPGATAATVAALLTLVLFPARRRLAAILCTGIAAAHTLPVYAGGDWMSEWRMMSYMLPLQLLAAVCFALACRERWWPRMSLAQRQWVRRLLPIAGCLLCVLPLSVRVLSNARGVRLPLSEVDVRADMWSEVARETGVLWPHVAEPDAGANTWQRDIRFTDLGRLGDFVLPRLSPHPRIGLADYVFQIRSPDFMHLHGAWEIAYRLQDQWDYPHQFRRLSREFEITYNTDRRNIVSRRLLRLDSAVSPYVDVWSYTASEPTPAPIIAFYDAGAAEVRVGVAVTNPDDVVWLQPCNGDAPVTGPDPYPEAAVLTMDDEVGLSTHGFRFRVLRTGSDVQGCVMLMNEAHEPIATLDVNTLPRGIDDVAATYLQRLSTAPQLVFAVGTGPLEPNIVRVICDSDRACMEELRASSVPETLSHNLSTLVDRIEPAASEPEARRMWAHAIRRAVGAPPRNRLAPAWRQLEGDCSVPDLTEAGPTERRNLLQSHFSCLDTLPWVVALPELLTTAESDCSMNARAVENECWREFLTSLSPVSARCVAQMRSRQLDATRALSSLFLSEPVSEVRPQALPPLQAASGVCVAGEALRGATITGGAAGSVNLVTGELPGIHGQSAPVALRIQTSADGATILLPGPESEALNSVERIAIVHSWTSTAQPPPAGFDSIPPWLMWPTLLHPAYFSSAGPLPEWLTALLPSVPETGTSWRAGALATSYVESVLYWAPQ